MSIATEISRIQASRDKIRTKLVGLGLVESTAKLDTCATAVEGIVDQGGITANVKEGETYVIPKGYHDGTGTVSGVAGGGNYELQSKTVTPTKSQQQITPDPGYYGLSDVKVNAIPEAYQDVSSVTATAADVLATKIIVTSDGTVTTGTMTNNGAVAKTLDAITTSYTVPAGYHNGEGAVNIVLEEKTATPSYEAQDITPTAGKVLSKVTVAAIPAAMVDTSDATGVAGDILAGKVVYVNGKKITGTMPNNGGVTKSLDGTTTEYTIPAGYHDGTGEVSVTVETKTATPTKEEQTISPTVGSLLSSVTVGAIPSQYQDVSAVTAVASDILTGKKIVAANGSVIEGNIPVNGALNATIDGLTTTSYTIPAGYTTGGSVTLSDDIETALAAI